MAKSIGTNKIKISVFISGRGSNLKSLLKYSKTKKSNFDIKLIVTNKKKAKGLIFAKKNGIPNIFVNYKNKNLAEKKILYLLNLKKIRFVCLAGFMSIISSKFINKFNGKIVNIHPSLLPRYKGLNTHERIIRNNETFSGFTIHFVNKKVDSGKIIFQKKIKILRKDTPKTLEKKILKAENKYYPIIISKYLSNL